MNQLVYMENRPFVYDDWKAFFNTLFHEGVVKEGDDELIAILRFCLLGLVQSSVDDFHRCWSS